MHTVPALFDPSGIVGGADRYALELARHMANRVPTTLVTFGEVASEERIGALAVKVLNRRWRIRNQDQDARQFHQLPPLTGGDAQRTVESQGYRWFLIDESRKALVSVNRVPQGHFGDFLAASTAVQSVFQERLGQSLR